MLYTSGYTVLSNAQRHKIAVERLEREERPTVLKPQVQRHTARRVLVVEDEPLILMSTIDMVEEPDHTVHEAKSAEVALGLLEGH